MEMNIVKDQNSYRVYLKGELTFNTVNYFEQQFSPLFRDLVHHEGMFLIIVNMREVRFMDSSGISALVRLHMETRRRLMDIGYCQFSPQVSSILQRTHVDEVLQVFDDERTAWTTLNLIDRHWPRYIYHGQGHLKQNNRTETVEFLNISRAGGRILAQQPITGEADLILHFDRRDLTSHVDIRWCSHLERGFGLGVKFLSDSEEFLQGLDSLLEELNQSGAVKL